MKQLGVAMMLAGLLTAGAGLPVQAQDQDKDRLQTRDQDRLQDRDQIYGYELMTEQERTEHRNRMRSLKTDGEREQYRLEHHKRMQARAKERGVTLPDEPMPRGKGMGPGGGMGPGMGGGRP